MRTGTSSSASRMMLCAFALFTVVLATIPWSSAQAVNGTWSALDASAAAPGPRREFVAVYDWLHHRYVIFSGLAGTMPNYDFTNQVWVLSLAPTPTWSQLSVLGGPPGPRAGAQYGYDPVRNRVLVFGGYGRHYPGSPLAHLNDVWELSLVGQPRWTELFPTGTPPQGRLAGAAAYDVLRQRFVGFGGTSGLPVDTWVLKLSGQPQWVTVASNGATPPGSYGMTSIYDFVEDRMIIFGGSTSEQYFGCHNNTWELRLRSQTPTWHQITPQGSLPSGRRTLASIFDPFRNRMVIYGGWDGASPDLSSFLGDTWALSLGANPTWTQLDPGGTLPPNRDAMSAIYDPWGDRMVLFGGWSGMDFLGDTQFLTWGHANLAGSASATTQAQPGIAHVTWTLTNATGPYVGVYRRDATGVWSSIGTAEADASGVVTFSDNTVEPGQSYDYTLVMASERGSEVSGETQVDVPVPTDFGDGTNVAFGVSRISPNPAVGRFAVSLALASAAPARLEIFDVRGRLVASRDVGSAVAGPRTVQMDRVGWTAGVYFVRLSQSGRTDQRRFVVTDGGSTR